MRRVPTARQGIDIFHTLTLTRAASPASSICRRCQQQFLNASRATQSAPFTSSSSRYAFANGVRNALWGSKEADRKQQTSSKNEENGELLRADEFGAQETSPTGLSTVDIPDGGHNNNYKEALTWHGLERVGSAAWVDKLRDTGEKYHGFLNDRKYVTGEAAKIAISKAVREIELLRTMGLPLNTSSQEAISAALHRMSADEPYPTTVDAETQLKDILSGRSIDDGVLNQSEKGPDEVFIDLPVVELKDPHYKFAVVKRVMQLTGIRISDPTINKCDSTLDLSRTLVIKPKPAKLVELISQNPNLVDLPNVSIEKRKKSSIQKETEVGRWKVIAKELKKRGLPLSPSGR